MPGRPTIIIRLNHQERETLKQLSKNGNLREQLRAKIILFRASEMTQQETAKQLSCSIGTVHKWTTHFRKHRFVGLGKHIETNTQAQREDRKIKTFKKKTKKPHKNATTLREISDGSGVSIATVSRVINNLPNVRKNVRERVWATAIKVGYRPDPELRKLMVHVRKTHNHRFRGRICLLETEGWSSIYDSYFRSVVAGAKQKAEALGFTWESFSMEAFLSRPKQISRLLYNRGVEGLFIPPVPLAFGANNKSLPHKAEWDKFSVVIATHSFSEASFRRVVPDHFKNMLLACRSLWALGYRKFGLILPPDLDLVSLRHYSGAFAAFHIEKECETIPPFKFNNADDLLAENHINDWFDKQKPDALITSGGRLAELIAKKLKIHQSKSVAVASIALLTDISSGIDEFPEIVGSLAIEQLGNMIIHKEKGIPKHPTVLLIEGAWREGKMISLKKPRP